VEDQERPSEDSGTVFNAPREQKEEKRSFDSLGLFLKHTHVSSSSNFWYYTPGIEQGKKSGVDETNVFISSGGTMANRNSSFIHAIWSNARLLLARIMSSRRKIVPTMVRLTDKFWTWKRATGENMRTSSFNLAHTHDDVLVSFWYISNSARWRMKGQNSPKGRGIYMQVPRRAAPRRHAQQSAECRSP